MSIGYACLTLGVRGTSLKSCTLKNASQERLWDITNENLDTLTNIIDYNLQEGIALFRISSDIIPFGSKEGIDFDWQKLFADKLNIIGDKARSGGIRLSMHPGQYTVLNSPDNNIVKRAILDLDYHCRFLDSLNLSAEHKIILHIGGIYGDKEKAITRFKSNYQHLEQRIKKRLVIENDDRLYNIDDVLEIGKALDIPVVFDNLHHQVNSSQGTAKELFYINACKATWKAVDGRQKIHYSQQEPDKRLGSHSRTICLPEFLTFYHKNGGEDLDIMLEVKDKNLSTIKCMNGVAVGKRQRIKYLEQEWHRYKYTVLEHSPQNYNAIRKLLKVKSDYPVEEFYELIENGLKMELNKGNQINALEHVWGYFKGVCTEKEKAKFLKDIESFKIEKKTLKAVKNNLKRLAEKYQSSYLLESYYFDL